MNESNAIEVFRQFQSRFETRLGRAENQSNQIRIYREWIGELTAQNRMLLDIVGEIERETVDRVDLFDSKVNEIVSQSQKSMIEMRMIGEFIGSLKTDLLNMVELVNRLMNDGAAAVFDDLRFTFTNIKEVLDANWSKLFPFSSSSNCNSANPLTKKTVAANEIAQEICESNFIAKNQQLLDRIKFKDELISSMQYELDSLRKQNCWQNSIANFASELKSFGERYEAFKASVSDPQMVQKRDIIELQKDTIEINQRNVAILVEKFRELKNQKDYGDKKINQFRDLLVNYQSLISDSENVLHQNKTKLLNMEKTVQLNKETIVVLEKSNRKYLNQLNDRNRLVDKLQIDIETMQINEEKLQNQIFESENRIEQFKIETNILSEELNRLRLQKRSNDEQICNLQEMVRKTSEQINELLSSEKNFRNILDDFSDGFDCKRQHECVAVESETIGSHARFVLNRCRDKYANRLEEIANRTKELAAVKEQIRVLELESAKDKSMYEASHRNELQLIEATESIRKQFDESLVELRKLKDEKCMQDEELMRMRSLCSNQETEIANLKSLAHDFELKFETSEKNRKLYLSKEKSLSRELNDRNNQIEKLSRTNRILEIKVSENENSHGNALRLKDTEISNLQKRCDRISQTNDDLLAEKNDLRNLFEQLIRKNDFSSNTTAAAAAATATAKEMPENVMDHFDWNDAFSEYWLQKIKSISNELIKSNLFWRNQWTERKDSSSN